MRLNAASVRPRIGARRERDLEQFRWRISLEAAEVGEGGDERDLRGVPSSRRESRAS